MGTFEGSRKHLIIFLMLTHIILPTSFVMAEVMGDCIDKLNSIISGEFVVIRYIRKICRIESSLPKDIGMRFTVVRVV